MESDKSPFLGSVRVRKPSEGASAHFPALKTAYDTGFLAMFCATLIAGVLLYFRHMGVNEKALFSLVLFAIGTYFGFILVWFTMARMVTFAPRFRFSFALLVAVLSYFVLALAPAALYRTAYHFEVTRLLLDMNKTTDYPNYIANKTFFHLAYDMSHLWYPLSLVIPLVLGFWFFWRSSPSYK